MKTLKIDQRRSGDVVILDLGGKINLGDGSAQLRAVVTELLEAGDRKILLNLADVSSMDSSGVGELVSSYARAKRYEGELKLINLAPRVHGLLEITKLVTVFETFESEAAALASFADADAASSPS
jgi:anti-sigma B factor antagonist